MGSWRRRPDFFSETTQKVMVPNTFQQNLKTSRELKFREQAFARVKTEVGGAGKAGTSLSRFSASWRRRPAFFSEMLPEAFPEAAFQVPKVPPGREQLVCTFGTAHGATMCVHEAKDCVVTQPGTRSKKIVPEKK